ncbi:MAG: Proline--tRNA ligase [Phycisphaerae bacterium]|nr:Proline--tRNA ligase [Phycisphaerae bacterium]
MRWTQTFIPTVKEVPADAEVKSHQLMVRAALIRKLASGTYTYLPLGWRSLRKAEAIIRAEMDAAGAIEIHMPVLQPIELWQATGRDQAYGENLMVVTDRHGRRNALGPTHEEVVTSLVADHVSSYKQLPVNLYQIQTKFRDEFRPRFGVLRSREFLMKDAYSFDADKAGLDASYVKMYDAYCRIFARCGLNYVVVEAESGPIGGDASHEFMIPTDAGEDIILHCPACRYAANQERAEVGKVEAPAAGPASPAMAEVHTPGTTTIEQVSQFLSRQPDEFIKTLIYVSESGQVVVGLVRGDHELNETKLARAAGLGPLAMADPPVIEKLTGAAVGFAGPQSLRGRDAKLIADPAVMPLRNAVTGANRTDHHAVNVDAGRDFDPETVADIRVALADDPCPRCGAPMAASRGIEVGHVFKLGTKYTTKLNATYLDEAGASHPIIMGCYGIGVNRILASAIEAGADDKGIVWPITIAPFEAIIVPIAADRNESVRVAADKLYADLTAAGVDVLIDDRDARPGVKFNDADLIGIPVRITVGDRGLKEGKIELKLRSQADVRMIDAATAADTVGGIVREMHQSLRTAAVEATRRKEA